MILLYYKGRGSYPVKGKDTISPDFQTKCDLIIGKREHKLRFDVEKNRFGSEKSNLTLFEMTQLLIYYGVRRLSSKYD